MITQRSKRTGHLWDLPGKGRAFGVHADEAGPQMRRVYVFPSGEHILKVRADEPFDFRISAFVGKDSAAHAKPHPAPLFLACKQAGLDPKVCIYVGDSDRDIEAGRAAGMLTIAAAYGYITPGEDVAMWKADAVINDMNELVATVANLSQRVNA